MRTPPRRTYAGALALALALTAGACTGDSDDAKPDPTASPSTGEPAAEVRLQMRVGKVSGELPRQRRQRVARQVAVVVDRWFDAAYVGGDWPRRGYQDAFPGFTDGAEKLARRQQRLTTNALLGERIDGVEVVRKRVAVDLLSPKRRPAAATARFRLVYRTTGDVERRVLVTGRLLLTKQRKNWRVFGFDVARSIAPVGKDRS